MQYLIPILVSIASFTILFAIRFFLRASAKRHQELGFAQATNHIIQEVKTRGEIDVTFNKETITLVAGKKSKDKNANNQPQSNTPRSHRPKQ